MSLSFVKRLQDLQPPLTQLLRIKSVSIVLSVGIVLLISLDILLAKNYERDQAFRLTLMAQKLQAQISSSINEHIAALLSINVVYQNFVDINRNDFEQYGQSITAHLPGFNRLLFIEPNYKISQIYPASPQNIGLFGLSVRSNDSLYENLMQAKTSRKEMTTGLIPFLGQRKTLLAILPVYRSKREFLGFAVGDISLDNIWTSFHHEDSLKNYQIQLVDPDQSTYFEGNNLGPKMANQDPTHLAVVPFHVTGKRWLLMLQYTNPFDALFFERLALWFSGFLILGSIMWLLARNNTHKSALGEVQKKFETIFESSPDAIALLDNQLHFQMANPTLEEWTQLNEDSLSTKTFFDIFKCQCPHLAKCRELSFMLCTSEQFDQELPERLEVDILNREENSPLKLRFSASRIKQKHGRVQEEGFICILGDISTSKELERHKETYVATLTHDLKTPLLAQEMVLDSLLSGATGPITDSQKKLLSASKQSIHDLLDMVGDSLLFYKLESSGLMINKLAHNMTNVLKETIIPLQPLATSRGISFELHTPNEPPDAWVDVVQMKRVFRNLLSNAISYAKRDSIIRINIEVTQTERLLIQVINEGKGMTEEELPRVFDKHYSLSRKFKQIGTGLGLYISRRIVELHGGKIWAISEPDKETSFFIELPLPKAVSTPALV